MIALDVQVDIKQAASRLSRAQRHALPTITRRAINDTAFGAKAKMERELPKRLDNPTPFTQRSMRVKKATPTHLAATVYIMPAQAKYLSYQVYGGIRRPQGRAIFAPIKRNVRLNKYGNVPGGRNRVKRMLARKNVFQDNGSIWQRKGKQVKLLAVYKDKVEYRPTFPFHEIARKEAERTFQRHFRRQALKVAT